MPAVLVVGGVSHNLIVDVDAFPAPAPQTLWAVGAREAIGSTGAGKAMNLARLGIDTTLHAMLGADPAGDAVRARLAAEPLRFLYDIDPAGTQRHVNLMDPGGDRISIFINDGSPDAAGDGPAVDVATIEAAVAGSDLVALNIRNYCRHLIPMIQRHGKPIWCDLHDYDGDAAFHRDFIAAADYVFVSSVALPDHRAFMRRVIDAGRTRLVVCTHGRGGATALDRDGHWEHTPIVDTDDTYDYTPRDTNGAGDALFAGFICGHLRGDSLRRCMRLGAIAAALCVTSYDLASPELSAETLARRYRHHFGDD